MGRRGVAGDGAVDVEATGRGGARLPYHWRIFSITISAIFLGSMDSGTLPVILPKVQEAFSSASSTTIAFVLNAYTIALAALVVVTGKLGDRTGRRRMFMMGGSLFIVGALLCAIAPSATFLVFARFVQGSGHALYTPASIGIILSVFPENRRSTAVGAWVGVGGLAAAIGPAVGGLIAEYSSWRGAFWLEVAVAIPVMVRAHFSWRKPSALPIPLYPTWPASSCSR